MQQGRASTIRFNEWICVCAQHEKAVSRLGRQVYQGYSRGLLSDIAALEICKEISQAFADSKRVRAELEEELERDALRGLSAEEAKAAEEVLELTSTEKWIRSLKLQATKLLGRGTVNRNLQSYRDRVREMSRDLGLRALAVYENEPLMKMESHIRLCQLAIKLEQESDKKWEEITKAKSDSGGLNLSFHTILISFVSSFANFSRGSAIGKALLKLMKYDAKEEEKKLTKQFEGSKTAEALQAQISEDDDVGIDVGSELESLEREYQEAPTDWGLPPRAASESWLPDTSDTWEPSFEQPPAPSKPSPSALPAMPAKTSLDGPKPQVLRQRRQSDSFGSAESWAVSSPVTPPEQDSWAPPPPAPVRNVAPPPPVEAPVDDWSTEFDDSFEPVSPSAPRLGSAPTLSPSYGEPFAPEEETELSGWGEDFSDLPSTPLPPQPAKPPSFASDAAPPPPFRPLEPAPRATNTAPPEAPPFQQPSFGESLSSPPPTRPVPATPPLQRRPEGRVPDLPPLPPLSARPIRSLDLSNLESSPPPPPPSPPQSDDPLLRLLRTEQPPVESPKSDDDDDLLPAFLRERDDDEPIDLSSSFIPDLPDTVDSGLKILPFGSQPKRTLVDDDDDLGTFIPQMPDD